MTPPVITATEITILAGLWFTCSVLLGLLLGYLFKVGQGQEVVR